MVDDWSRCILASRWSVFIRLFSEFGYLNSVNSVIDFLLVFSVFLSFCDVLCQVDDEKVFLFFGGGVVEYATF